MNSTNNIFFKEKYFSLKNETRINRLQFFIRMIFPIIVLWGFFISPIVTLVIKFTENGFKNGIYAFIILYILYGIFVIKALPNIIKKRTHDFGKDGTIETTILVFGTIFYIGYLIYIGYLGLNLDFNEIVELSKGNNTVFNIVSLLNNIIGIILILLSLYLSLRPGDKGTNQYGEAKYYKLDIWG